MADPRLDQAKAFMASGDLQGAMSLLKALLKDAPSDKEVRILLTAVQERMMLQMQIDQKLKKAEELLAAGNQGEAEKLLQDVLKTDPANAKALGMLPSGAAMPVTDATVLEELPAFDADELAEAPAPAPGAPSTEELPSLPEASLPEAPAHAQTVIEDADAFPEGDGGGGFELDTDGMQTPPYEGPPPDQQPSTFEMEAPAPEADDFLPAEPAVPASPADAPPPDASLGSAEMERIQAYLAEGKAKAAEGNYQDAVDVWTRVFILDETNAEAQALIDDAREKMNAGQQELEFAMQEAVAAYNAGDLDRAKPLLEKVVQKLPGHREASHYLEKIREQEAAAPQAEGGGFELDTSGDQRADGGFVMDFESAPDGGTGFEPEAPAPPPPQEDGAGAGDGSHFSFDAEEAAAGGGDEFELETGGAEQLPTQEAFAAEQAAAREAEPDIPDLPPEMEPDLEMVEETPVKKGPPTKAILIGFFLVVILGVAGIVVPKFLKGGEGDSGKTPAAQQPKKAVRPPPPPPPPPMNPMEYIGPQLPSTDVLLRMARTHHEDGNLKLAIIYFEEILNQVPSHHDAEAGLRLARSDMERYRQEEAEKHEFLQKFLKAKEYFNERQFRSCLQISWRLIYHEEDMARKLKKDKAIRNLIRDGYYNWAVHNLKRGNVSQADENLTELLREFPGDRGAKDLKNFCRKHMETPVDARYRDTVRDMPYRPVPDNQ